MWTRCSGVQTGTPCSGCGICIAGARHIYRHPHDQQLSLAGWRQRDVDETSMSHAMTDSQKPSQPPLLQALLQGQSRWDRQAHLTRRPIEANRRREASERHDALRTGGRRVSPRLAAR